MLNLGSLDQAGWWATPVSKQLNVLRASSFSLQLRAMVAVVVQWNEENTAFKIAMSSLNLVSD